jgi:hypothetical protein
MPTVSQALPEHLNPDRFKSAFDEFYFDEYSGHYNVTLGRRSFAIKPGLPLRIYLIEGVHGKEFEERHTLLPFLQIAEAMHSETGKWPDIDVEWELMCPGGLLLLDISSLAVAGQDSTLPSVVSHISSLLDKLLSRRGQDFAGAERHYRRELSGIAAFGEAMSAIQREFDQQPVRVVNTNTKVRRLRYLTVVGSLASTGTTSLRINSQLLSWAASHVEALSSYSDPKGAVLAATGQGSALPYLEAAKSLGILAPIGRGLVLTNSGRALMLLPTNRDRFELTDAERLFFLFDLLNYDRDMLCPLLLLLRENPTMQKAELRKAFPEAYRSHLVYLRKHCGTARSRRYIDATLTRSKQWQSAEKYMEHIVDPRVSWFVDLALCSLKDGEVALLPKGKELADQLAELVDEGVFVITQDFLRRWFFKAIARYSEGLGRTIETKLKASTAVDVLRRCCEDVRKSSASLAPNRVVASTLFRLTSIILFTEYSVAVDFSDLRQFFSRPENATTLGWRLRWSAAQNDGYLTPVSYSGATS